MFNFSQSNTVQLKVKGFRKKEWSLFKTTQCSSQKILLEGQSGPYKPFLGATYFKKGKLPTYPSPKLTLTLTSRLGKMMAYM